MRTSVAAFALFRRAAPAGRVEYLAQWNEGWHAFHFVGGHKRDNESFRDCCVREVSEELGLIEECDFRIEPERRSHLRYIHWSERAQTDTAYTVELFDAELLSPAAASVEADANNRWLTESDIRAGRCRDGRAVSATMLRILSLAGLTPDEFDLFVSYAHKDDSDGWISALLDAIRAEHHAFTSVPLRIFFDREAIRDMADWEHRILTGLRSAKVMLAVLSPAYVASAFCRREWETYLDHELALALPGDGIAPLYTVTVPGFEEATEAAVDKMLANLSRRQYLDVRPWRAEGIAALRRDDVRLRLRQLDDEIDQRLRRAARVAASPIHNLPAHNRNFVGRHDELRQLREIVACNRIGAIAAVRGLGGIGKTALAYEYAHAFAEFYPGGRFVLRAEAATDFRAVVVDQLRDELGIELSDDEKKSYDLSFPRLWNVLKGRGRSLVVLDNLDQPEVLAGAKQRGILPAGDAVHVVATTRLEAERLEDRQHVQCLLVDALAAEDGLELLKRFREPAGDEEWKAALALVHRLGGHALALEVVGVFLWKHPEIGYADYLARLEAEGAGAVEGAAKGTPVEHISRHPEKFIGRLLEPTLATLSPVEVRVLEYAARLPADSVPLPWLEALVRKDMADALTKRPGYPDPWLETMRRLDGLRLLVIDRTEPRLGRMHRVVRDVVISRVGIQDDAGFGRRVRDTVLLRSSDFRAKEKELIQKFLRGGESRAEVEMDLHVSDFDAVFDDGSFVLRMKSWERECFLNYALFEIRNGTLDSIEWILRAELWEPNPVLIEYPVLTEVEELVERRLNEQPSALSWLRVQGMLLFVSARVYCRMGFDQKPYRDACKAVEVLQTLSRRLPGDPEIQALLSKAEEHREMYGWF